MTARHRHGTQGRKLGAHIPTTSTKDRMSQKWGTRPQSPPPVTSFIQQGLASSAPQTEPPTGDPGTLQITPDGNASRRGECPDVFKDKSENHVTETGKGVTFKTTKVGTGKM